MKKVTLAKSAGFCFGVRRAVDEVYRQADSGRKPIYTYGPIIHNEEVVKELAARGVEVLSDLSDLSGIEEGTIIIRSHGISKKEQEAIEASRLTMVDATCPFVKKIHRHVEEYSNKGYHIIVIGNAGHPEVSGILGWAQNDCPEVINSAEEAQKVTRFDDKPLCIVAQTTFNLKKFQELVEILKKNCYNIIVLNTICNATQERQTEARRIAAVSDAMIVIGDRHSSNTQKLFEICKSECANTYCIQTSSEMDYHLLESVNNVGITAGASTPNNIIEEVSKNVRH